MSVPTGKQTLRVEGEIQIVNPVTSTATVQGRLAFVDQAQKVLGVLKVFGGTLSNYRLILDTAGITNGLSIRTAASQGIESEGGSGQPYTATFKASGVEINSPVNIYPQLGLLADSSDLLMSLSKNRNSSTLASGLQDTLLEVKLSSMQLGQAAIIELGYSATFNRGIWGYRGGYTPNTQNYAFHGFRASSSVVKENIKYTQDGNVSIPLRLDAGTVYATTYLNLPAVTPSQILPLTLDNTQKRVGINNTNPAQALDVVGNIGATGSVIADTVQAANWVGLPAVDLSPITLDKVGGKVGINNTTPQADLDVDGQIQCQSLQTNDMVVNALAPGEGLYVAGEIEFPSLTKQDQPSILSYDHTSGKVYYADKPSTDLTPITLDAAQNRVGIRQTSPQTDLDVNGTTSTNFLLLQSIPNLTQPDVLMYDPATKAVSYGPAPSPTPDILPITLDKTNTRVGINNATPASTLDVGGTITAPTFNMTTSNGFQINKSVFLSQRSTGAVGIGTSVHSSVPGVGAVAIGSQAGQTTQGANAIALGYQAGKTNQHANSIIVNATGLEVNSTAASSLYVKPIRAVVDPTMPRLSYNATTGEIMYGNSTNDSLLPITLDKTLSRVGINNATPTTALDVAGAVTASGAIVSGSTTTSTLSLTGIANSTTTNVLMYDTTTKAVSYGAAPRAPATKSQQFLTANVTAVASGTIQSLANVTLPPGTYVVHAYINLTSPSGGTVSNASFGIKPQNNSMSAYAADGYPTANPKFDTSSLTVTGEVSTILTITVTKAIFLNALVLYSGGTPSYQAAQCGISAVLVGS
jgi:hypothetical protein